MATKKRARTTHSFIVTMLCATNVEDAADRVCDAMSKAFKGRRDSYSVTPAKAAVGFVTATWFPEPAPTVGTRARTARRAGR
jgi:hypothetical protein